MKKKIRVVFIIPTLMAGGAERVMSYIPQHLNKNEFDVSLVVIGSEDDAAYKVESINVIYMNKKKIRESFFPIIAYLNNEKPHIVISAIGHLNLMMTAISLFFRNTKFVGRETMVRSASLIKSKKKLLESFYSNFQKKYLDAIICQSLDMKNDLLINYNYPEKKLVIINNPITKKFDLKITNKPHEPLRLISVGRLEKHKGYVRIINALSQLDFPFEYTIIGSGSYYSEINKKIIELGLCDKIKFIEFTDKVQDYMKSHDIYLHGSYLEGFPNTILESCAVGTPVVAFDAPGGINELISPGINGYIATNEEEFINFIIEIKNSVDMPPEQIRSSVMNKFSPDKILGDYENFIKETVNK